MMEAPVLIGSPSDAELTLKLTSHTWSPPTTRFRLALLVTLLMTLGLFALILYTFVEGIGLWGNNVPVAWAFAIINFVWWIGIGHAGTFISAILLLLEQSWRTSINRFAEAMTLFAVLQAALFPLLHLGRPWFFYYLVPYPSTLEIWPQFKSALPWDFAAVATYGTVSLLFWYLGLVPDLAAVRDGAPTRLRRVIYGVFALGFSGSARHFAHYRIAYGLLAGLATPLVVSVHSIVSSDFAITMLPGWHSTIFPPYFVAGAIFSGFAMVQTLLIPARHFFDIKHVITERHVDNIAKLILVTGLVVAFSYICEFFIAWYSGEWPEMYVFFESFLSGPNALYFWLAIGCNVLAPQLYWFKKVRIHPVMTWIIAGLVNVGMWSERFFLIVLSLQRDYLPGSWQAYTPSWVDWGILAGTMGFFMFVFLLFLKFVPFVPVMEVKELAAEGRQHPGRGEPTKATAAKTEAA